MARKKIDESIEPLTLEEYEQLVFLSEKLGKYIRPLAERIMWIEQAIDEAKPYSERSHPRAWSVEGIDKIALEGVYAFDIVDRQYDEGQEKEFVLIPLTDILNPVEASQRNEKKINKLMEEARLRSKEYRRATFENLKKEFGG